MSSKTPRRKLESSFIYTTYNYDLYRVTVKFHTDIPKDIQLMERARNRSLTYHGDISQQDLAQGQDSSPDSALPIT